MPKGFEGLRKRVAEIEARKEAAGDGDFTPSLWFKLPDSASGKLEEEITSSMRAIIRPLEERGEVHYAAVHPVQTPNSQWKTDIVCRDQENEGEPCPGCEAGFDRKLKGWINVIWRDAPDFPLDEATGKYNTKVDYESLPKSDKVAILSSGPVMFDRLAELDEDVEGLTNCDFSITRNGLKLNTKYKIKKVKKSALTAADKELAADKTDLEIFSKVLDYEDWQNKAKGITPSRNGDGEDAPVPKNPLGGSLKENIFEKA